jgi:hypothetical protein
VTDNVEKLEEVDARAKELLARKFSSLGHVHQLAVRALCAYQQSYYQDAFESSRMALSLSNDLGMASFQGPLDINTFSLAAIMNLLILIGHMRFLMTLLRVQQKTSNGSGIAQAFPPSL